MALYTLVSLAKTSRARDFPILFLEIAKRIMSIFACKKSVEEDMNKSAIKYMQNFNFNFLDFLFTNYIRMLTFKFLLI